MLSLFFSSALAATVQGADDPARQPRWDRADAWGQIRLRSDHLSGFPVDEDGTALDRTTWFSSRVLAGGWFEPVPHLRLDLAVDALTGPFAGDRSALGATTSPAPFREPRDGSLITPILPRAASVTWDGPRLQGSAGLQSFSWGTGFLAHDGVTEPMFGDAWTGAVNLRARLSATPWRPDADKGALRGLAFFAAGDRVLRDDNAAWFDGDEAWAALGGVRWFTPRSELSVLVVRRWQRDADHHPEVDARWTTTVWPVDITGEVTLTPLDAHQHVTLQGELVSIRGHTWRLVTPETIDAGATVQSLGGLARVRYDHDKARVSATLDAVYASGDNDTRDDVVRTFSANSDFSMGLLLVDQVLPMLSARAADRVADPALAALPPEGLRHAISQGQVSNLMALYPTVRWRPWRTLDVRAGWLAARGAGDVLDVYQTALNGGYNAPPGGGSPDDRGLGHELDLGAHYTFTLPGDLALRLGAEGAVLKPGSAFDGLELGTPVAGRGRLDLSW